MAQSGVPSDLAPAFPELADHRWNEGPCRSSSLFNSIPRFCSCRWNRQARLSAWENVVLHSESAAFLRLYLSCW